MPLFPNFDMIYQYAKLTTEANYPLTNVYIPDRQSYYYLYLLGYTEVEADEIAECNFNQSQALF